MVFPSLTKISPTECQTGTSSAIKTFNPHQGSDLQCIRWERTWSKEGERRSYEHAGQGLKEISPEGAGTSETGETLK